MGVGRRVYSPADVSRVCCGEEAGRYGDQIEPIKSLSGHNCDWLVFGEEGDFEGSEGTNPGVWLCCRRHFCSVCCVGVSLNAGKTRYIKACGFIRIYPVFTSG